MASTSIFKSLKHIYIRASGWLEPPQGKGILFTIMEATENKYSTILLGRTYFDKSVKYTRYQVTDVNGNEQMSNEGISDDCTVTSQYNAIGSMKYDKINKTCVLQNLYPPTTLQSARGPRLPYSSIRVTNASGQLVAEWKHPTPGTIELEIFQELSENEIKLVLLYALMTCKIVFSLNKECLPTLRFSTPNSNYCPGRTVTDSYSRNNLLRQLNYDSTYTIRAAGRNSRLNLVYFNITDMTTNFVSLSLECTPSVDHVGFAKLVAKDEFDLELFTAVMFPADSCMAIYGTAGTLVGFEIDRHLRNGQGSAILTVNSAYNAEEDRRYYGSRGMAFRVVDPCAPKFNNVITKINARFCNIQVHTTRSYQGQKTFLKVAFDISFTVKLFFEVFKMDKYPIPEITYCYAHQDKLGDVLKFSSF